MLGKFGGHFGDAFGTCVRHVSDVFQTFLPTVFRQCSENCPTIFQQFSDKFPTNFRRFSDNCPTVFRQFSDNLDFCTLRFYVSECVGSASSTVKHMFELKLVKQMRKAVQESPNICQQQLRKCPENIREFSVFFPGKFPENFRMFPGNNLEMFRKISGNFPEHFRKQSGYFLEHFQKFPTGRKSWKNIKLKLTVKNPTIVYPPPMNKMGPVVFQWPERSNFVVKRLSTNSSKLIKHMPRDLSKRFQKIANHVMCLSTCCQCLVNKKHIKIVQKQIKCLTNVVKQMPTCFSIFCQPICQHFAQNWFSSTNH